MVHYASYNLVNRFDYRTLRNKDTLIKMKSDCRPNRKISLRLKKGNQESLILNCLHN